MNGQQKTGGSPNEYLDGLLASIDEGQFQELCRKLRILLAKGMVDQACSTIQEFAGREVQLVLSPDTSVQACGLDQRVANYLEQAGFRTLGSLAGVEPSTIRALPNCGEFALADIRKILQRMLNQQRQQRGPEGVHGFATDRPVIPAPREYRGVKA